MGDRNSLVQETREKLLDVSNALRLTHTQIGLSRLIPKATYSTGWISKLITSHISG